MESVGFKKSLVLSPESDIKLTRFTYVYILLPHIMADRQTDGRTDVKPLTSRVTSNSHNGFYLRDVVPGQVSYPAAELRKYDLCCGMV